MPFVCAALLSRLCVMCLPIRASERLFFKSTSSLIMRFLYVSLYLCAHFLPHSCWIVDRYVFYTAFIGPVAASVLYNFLVVIAISQSLWRDRKAEGPIKSKSRNKPVLYLTTVAALSVMLGLTWMFGLLVLFFDKPGMDYIFAILNSLQGVFIFVNTFRDGDVRAQWKARVTSIMSQQPTLTAHPYMTTVRYGRRNALQDGSVDTGTSGKGRAIVSPEVPDCLDRNKLGGSIATLSYEAQSTTV